MKKRIISLLLAVMMIVGMLPMAAMAEEAAVEEVVCEHTAVTETTVSNDDGTHTVKNVCDECGETVLVLDEPSKIEVDLEAAVAEAAEAGMFDAYTLTADGLAFNVYENRTALAEFNTWTQQNYGWQIASTTSALTFNSTYVKTFIDVTGSYD